MHKSRLPPCAVMSSAPHKNSTMTSVSRHTKQDVVCGLREWGWSPESWPREGSGLGMAECKGQAFCGAVGVEREAGAAVKVDLS